MRLPLVAASGILALASALLPPYVIPLKPSDGVHRAKMARLKAEFHVIVTETGA